MEEIYLLHLLQLEMMKMFWRWMVVMTAQQCDYI